MYKKKIAVILTIIFIMNLSFGLAFGNMHVCTWKTYYGMKNDNATVYKYMRSCCGGYRNLGTVYTFKPVEFDLYLNQPSGVTSANGIGFEYGTTLLKNTHFGINNIEYTTTKKTYRGDTRSYVYKDEETFQKTALNNNKFSNASKYDLNLSEGNYTLKGKIKDIYPGKEITENKSFYVGPYPTVSCKVDLVDDNKSNSHIDSIKIHDIKLKSTYQPQELRFELYKGNTYTGKSYTALANATNAYATGYNSTFNDITLTNIGMNLKPGEQINIRVRVVDGRGTGTASATDPNAPKYAKYSNTSVF